MCDSRPGDRAPISSQPNHSPYSRILRRWKGLRAAIATAEPAAPAPLTLQQVDTTTGGSSAGSAALALQDIIKDPAWLLLPFILGGCVLASISASGQVCHSPAM